MGQVVKGGNLRVPIKRRQAKTHEDPRPNKLELHRNPAGPVKHKLLTREQMVERGWGDALIESIMKARNDGSPSVDKDEG